MGNWITNYQLCGMKLNCKLLSSQCIDLTLFNADFLFLSMPASLTEKKKPLSFYSPGLFKHNTTFLLRW